ncbi:MAG: hypothetical protein GX977_02700, partial [Firmicutes bacterium]|nr:hypothetical protein [Bacillota bacterium]
MFFVAAGGQYYWQEGKDGLIVELADNAGFCFGVKRAIDAATRTADEHQGVPIHTLGPLIHSPQTVSRLAKLGIQVAHKIE